MIRYSRVRIHPAALKHGESHDAIRHALRHHVHSADLTTDAGKMLIIGPDRAGNLLELIGAENDEALLIIHAMRLRLQYTALLHERN